jgi:hypothetical protein
LNDSSYLDVGCWRTESGEIGEIGEIRESREIRNHQDQFQVSSLDWASDISHYYVQEYS